MNENELKAAIVKRGYTNQQIAEKIGISKTALYRKMKGEVQFRLCEITSIIKELNLKEAEINTIFFADKVS